MIERKTIIKKIQKILQDHYNHYVFGSGNETFNDDEEKENFINIFTDLQYDFDDLYEELGYKYIGSYEDDPKKIEESASQK